MKFPISSPGPKGGNTQFLQDAERNATYFGKFKLGYCMYIGPGAEETCKFDKYPDNPKGKTSCGSIPCTEKTYNLAGMKRSSEMEG